MMIPRKFRHPSPGEPPNPRFQKTNENDPIKIFVLHPSRAMPDKIGSGMAGLEALPSALRNWSCSARGREMITRTVC